MTQDARRSPRYPFFASAEITETHSHALLPARTSELARHGCYMDMMNPFLQGTALHIRISHQGEMLDAPARVVHSQPNIGMGLAFNEMDPAHEQLLEKWFTALQQS